MPQSFEVEVYYCPDYKTWATRVTDQNDDQIGDVSYTHLKADAVSMAKSDHPNAKLTVRTRKYYGG